MPRTRAITNFRMWNRNIQSDQEAEAAMQIREWKTDRAQDQFNKDPEFYKKGSGDDKEALGNIESAGN